MDSTVNPHDPGQGPPTASRPFTSGTGLSKESSMTLFSDPTHSREPSFISVDEQLHLQAHLATLPEVSPHEGEPLLDSEGNYRTLVPRNVDVRPDQYYTKIKPDGTPLLHRDRGRIRQKVSTGHLPTPSEKTQSDINVKESSIVSADSAFEGPPKETPKDGEEKKTSENENPEEVFPTQVDETVLEAAKKRQDNVFDPAWMMRDDKTPSMAELVSEKANYHFNRGMSFVDTDAEKAIQCFNKALNLQPNDVRVYVYRGEVLFRLTDFKSAILNYKRACVLDPENETLYNRLAFFYYFYGQCLFDQKLFSESLEAFTQATEMRPEVVGYHTRSVACLAALQRHGECLALVNKRLEFDQDNADLYIMRARLHQLFRNATLCYYDVKDALAIDPAHQEAKALMDRLEKQSVELRQQCTQLNLIGRHRDALQKISMAIETNPSIAEHHLLRGAIHRRLNDFNAAIDDYLLALDKTNHDESNSVYQEAQRQLLLTYNDFAVECFTKGYYDEAIILLNKAIKGEKREKGLYVNRGDCFFKKGNLQFAMADYEQALDLDEADPSIKARVAVVHNDYGVQEFQDKNFREADSHFSKAIQNNPRVASYYISRCRTKQMMEHMSAARQDILAALLLDPGDPELMPLVTHMFPGKSIRDILHSRAAAQARKNLDSLMADSLPMNKLKLSDGIPEKSLSLPPPATDASAEAAAAPQFPEKTVTSTTMLESVHKFAELKSCIGDDQFNRRLAAEKHVVNDLVKTALSNRMSLRPVVGRIQPLPDAKPFTRLGGHFLHKEQSTHSDQPLGWRNFSMGIKAPGAVD